MNTKIIKYSPLFLAALFFLNSCNSKKEEVVTAEIEPKTETFLLEKEKLTTELRLPAELTGFQQVDFICQSEQFRKIIKS